MVEEGVTWFAQVSPRQPRQLVVVLPTLSGLFAPLPLLATIAGIWGVSLARRRGSRSLVAAAAGAGALWCATALVAKPMILVREALLEPTAVAYWLMVVAA